MTRTLSFQRWRVAMIGLASALVLMLLFGTPQGRDAAAQFLAQFRSERFAAVSLSTSQIANVEQTMSDLQHLGEISGVDTAPEPQVVASVTEASQFVEFPVLVPDPATLPAGVSGTPTAVRVMPAHEVRFTFDLTQARAYYQSIGQNDVNLPERFDGASLVVHTPPAVLLQYRSGDAPADSPIGSGLVVGEAGTVTVDVDGGVTLNDLRQFLLQLPGLSPQTVRQLQAIDDWETTLPVPIPVDQINWERATIAGGPGLLLNDNTGLGSAAIWQHDGRIFGIVGAMKARELQRVAESLR
jgi:hypothetical protein